MIFIYLLIFFLDFEFEVFAFFEKSVFILKFTFFEKLDFLKVCNFLYKSCLEKPKKLKNAGQNKFSFRELFFDIAEFSK